jgi:serine/threonine protein kinase
MNICNGKYTVLETIGQGKFGIVYRGKNNRTGIPVAIKIETVDVLLLKREATILHYLYEQRCREYSATIYWYGLYNNAQCLVMTYYHKNILECADKNNTMYQCISALSAIHRLNIVHRDIKPANFMLTIDNRVNLIDFGLAIFINSDTSNSSDTDNSVVGTPRYISPYIHSGLSYTFRDDLISLGYVYMYLTDCLWYGNPTLEQLSEMKQWNNICQRFEPDSPIKEYMEYCYHSDRTEYIDYTRLKSLFSKMDEDC